MSIELVRSEEGIRLNQRKYALKLILEAGSNPSVVPMDQIQKLIKTDYDNSIDKNVNN